MTDKEKLMQILNVPIFPHVDADPLEAVADYLLDNDVRPVRHAHWVENDGSVFCFCSRCKGLAPYDEWEMDIRDKKRRLKSDYCPNCGAKMDDV